MKINAFALYGKEDLRPHQWEMPELEPGGVVLRIDCCGICGSDLRMFYDGPSPRYDLPVVLGHEIAGTVEVVGPKVKNFIVGDVVTVAPLIPCMNCQLCANGQDNLCENGLVIGVNIPGAMADYFYVPEQMVRVGGLVKVPTDTDVREASMTEIVSCCLHGLRQTDLDVGANVLIIGEGPVGLIFLRLLRLMGADKVVVTGLIEHRLKLAERMGATVALDVNKYDLEQYASNKKFHPDLSIVAAPTVPGSQTALKITRPGGSILLFSGYPYGTTMPFELYKFHYAEKHIHGSIDSTIRDFQNAAELVPKLGLGDLITQSFPLEEIPQAFREARGMQAIKTIIEP